MAIEGSPVIIFQFFVATVLPALAVWSLCTLEQRTDLVWLDYWRR